MHDSLYLAWSYLRHHRLTASVLVAAVALIIFLPAALQVIVHHAERHFRSRAADTPLVIGPRGSELELILTSVYFSKPLDRVMDWRQLQRVEQQELGEAIPLHARYEARDCQVVGTTVDYLIARRLRLAHGEVWNILGECVVGASAAERLELEIGDKIPVSSSPAFVLDSPPLRLRVAGILAATETPDDEAIFVDVKTTWILEGLGHGHAASAAHGSPGAELYTDITAENAASFHFHGSRDAFPISAAIVYPNSDKSETMLLGQYFSPDQTVQIVRPEEVMQSLLEQILMIRSYMVAAIALVSAVTLLTMALVIVLSIRLRQAELTTMTKIGCSRNRIASILGMQVALLLITGAAIAGLLIAATSSFGPELVRLVVL